LISAALFSYYISIAFKVICQHYIFFIIDKRCRDAMLMRPHFIVGELMRAPRLVFNKSQSASSRALICRYSRAPLFFEARAKRRVRRDETT